MLVQESSDITSFRLKLKSQIWNGSFREILKFSKNGKKIESLTFRRVIIFCVRQLGRNRFCRGILQHTLFRLKLKYQIWDGSFREMLKIFIHGQKIENLTFRKIITFCVHTNRRVHLCSGASQHTLYSFYSMVANLFANMTVQILVVFEI